MSYKVVPFNAGIVKGEGADRAASQLETLINEQQAAGWSFRGLETLQTVVTTPAVAGVPGKAGCMGIGYKPPIPGTPERRDTTLMYVAVFEEKQS
jgi:hypothetical protein